MTNSEFLKAKSLGVKDCVKWIESKIKLEKQKLKNVEDKYQYDYYEGEDSIKQKKMSTLISIKVGLDKYQKKLNHESNEAIDEKAVQK